MNKRFDYVFWDLDGTLSDFDSSEKYGIRKCFEIFRMGCCTDEMLAVYSRINQKHWEMLERGEITKAQVMTGRMVEFFDLYNLDTSVVDEFNRKYQYYLGEKAEFMLHGREIVLLLQNQVKQYIVTNGNHEVQMRKLHHLGLDTMCDGAFTSEAMGAEKPAADFFDKVFESCGINAENKDRILIVGDSLTSDIRGGNNAGIHTCWYNPAGKANDAGVQIDYEVGDLLQVAEIVSGYKE